MRAEDDSEVQHDKQRQTPDEVPLLGLVADDAHGEEPADCAPNQAEPQQACLRRPTAIVAATCRHVLVPSEHDKGDQVDGGQVDAQDLESGEVPSRCEADDARVQRHEAEAYRRDEPPCDETDDGEKPPRDVALVHAMPATGPRDDEQREQHPQRTARDREDIHDEGVCRRVVDRGPAHADVKVDDERQKRHRVYRYQIEKEWIQIHGHLPVPVGCCMGQHSSFAVEGCSCSFARMGKPNVVASPRDLEGL